MKKYIFLFILLALSTFSFGQISLTASTDAKQVLLGSTLNVKFTLKNARSGNIVPPDFKGFDLINQSTNSNVSIINGRQSSSLGYNYNLMPKKVGKYTIGVASVTIKGKTYKTKPLQIEVLKGKKTKVDAKGNALAEVFIMPQIDTTIAYIGQQIILDYKIFMQQDVASFQVRSQPDFAGFFAQDVNINAPVTREIINGQEYSTKILRRVALFPQQAGLLEIQPYNIIANIPLQGQSNNNHPFFRSFQKTKPLPIKADGLSIEVRELPSNAPNTFTGAVGHYKMHSTINKTTLTTDDALNLRVVIQGDGDNKRVQAPQLNLPDAYEVYDPREVNDPEYVEYGKIMGQKTYEYLIVPKKTGKLVFKPSFTYFDTDAMTYRTISPNGHAIFVKQGTGKSTVKEEKKDIYPLKINKGFFKERTSFFGTPLFYAGLGFPFLLLFGGFFLKHKQNNRPVIDPEEQKRLLAQKVALKRLEQAKVFLDKKASKDFYNEISLASWGYVCDKLNVRTSELSKSNIQNKLTEYGFNNTLVERFLEIIKTSEMALFAGMTNENAMEETYNEAIAIISEMEKQA